MESRSVPRRLTSCPKRFGVEKGGPTPDKRLIPLGPDVIRSRRNGEFLCNELGGSPIKFPRGGKSFKFKGPKSAYPNCYIYEMRPVKKIKPLNIYIYKTS